jgi:hypothetical protein
MVRMTSPDGADDIALGHPVDLAHEVVTSLRADLDTVEPVDVTDNDIAGTACGADAYVQ